ncbi:MAG: CehA/McbA family metallohydrolase [Clostridiales bacterium]|nr:CehA/McbA family metallohydrolase [Clostridiales bacterium]
MIVFERGSREYKGNLHLHTTASDGRLSPLEAAQAYEAAGYDFIAVTDHRRLTILEDYQGPMALLRGIELDDNLSQSEVIHLLGIGVDQDFTRHLRPGLPSQEALELIHAHGGLCFLAHPHWSLNRLSTLQALQGLDGVEIYNGFSGPPYNPPRAEATQLLDLLAVEGQLLPTIATDDTHYYGHERFTGFTLVQADSNSPGAILEALRQGRYYASCGPRFERVSLVGDRVEVACSPVQHIIFHSNLPWNGGRVVSGEALTQGNYRLNRDGGERFVRVVLEDSQGRRAWLNPFSL